MAWDDEISIRLHDAFNAGQVEDFKALLREHPSHLRDDDGTDFWMWKAAMHGSLPMLQAVVEMGVGVNEPHDRGSSDDPFSEPEGPILQAARGGHTAMVCWLLDAGARINYVIGGRPRCLPLIAAATEGHADIVRLLVDRGADVHSTWQGLDAVKQTETFGHYQIAEYLRSVMNQQAAQ